MLLLIKLFEIYFDLFVISTKNRLQIYKSYIIYKVKNIKEMSEFAQINDIKQV